MVSKKTFLTEYKYKQKNLENNWFTMIFPSKISYLFRILLN